MMSFGRSNITTVGMIVMGASMIGFAISHYIEDKNTFIVFTLFIRFCQGLASSSIQTSVYSIITIVYPDKMERVIGYIEATMGVALVVGPLFGSVAFYFGGYQAPFLILGTVFFIFVFLGRSNIKNLERVIEIQKDTEQVRKEILNKKHSNSSFHSNEMEPEAYNLMVVNESSPSQSFDSKSINNSKADEENKSKETVVFAKISI